MDKYIPKIGSWFLPQENGKSIKHRKLGTLRSYKGHTYTREGAIRCTSLRQSHVWGIDERGLIELAGRRVRPNRVFNNRCTNYIPVERDV